MDKKDLSLDLDFFESVIAYNALTNDIYLASIIDEVKPKFFNNADIRVIVDLICQFYQKRNTTPSITELKAHLSTDEEKNSFKKVALSFKQLDSEYNIDELYENTERFLKEKAVYNAVLETANMYSKDDDTQIDPAETLTKFEDACGISLVDDLGRDYFNEIDDHCADLQKTYKYVSTGWKWLDRVLGGGLMEDGRAMYTFSGVTNSGKSIILGNIGTNVLAQNKTAILISLEMSELAYTQRIDSQLSRIPIRELGNEVDSLKDFVNKYKEQHSGARLFVKEYAPKSVTVNHIRAYIEKLRQKKKIQPDVIIVDYVNLIQPTIVTGNTYVDVKLVAEQLRALSYIFKCPVITATQLNRSAFDELSPGLETTSESMGLSMTTDFQASVWSSDEDKELGIIHISLQKNRFGQCVGTSAFKIDYNTLAIDELEDEFVDNDQVNDASDILGRLSI